MYDFLQFASPLATLIAAGVAAYYARQLGKGQIGAANRQAATAEQQAKLADMRFRHDLFERRFEVYEAARALLIEIGQSNTASDEGISRYVRGTDKAVFFFDQSTVDYLIELRQEAFNLRLLAITLHPQTGLPNGPERDAASAKRAERSLWFLAQFDVLLEKFKPFMAIGEVTATHAPPPAKTALE